MRSFVLLLALCVTVSAAKPGDTVVVNEYFGVKYSQEPVSFDVDLTGGVDAKTLGLEGVPSQVEIVQPGKLARVWTLVDFSAPGQYQFKIGQSPRAPVPFKIADAGAVGRVKLVSVGNPVFSAKVPVGTVKFEPAISAFEVPGPVVSVSMDGQNWIGSGYLDTILRVKSITCEVEQGPVFWQSRIRYEFEQDKTYTAQVRIYAAKPYAQLVEDFNLGGASKYIFNFDDWFPEQFIGCGDQAQTKNYEIGKMDAGDFINVEGQKCLNRLVVWTQFGYFGGKTETTGLIANDASHAVGGFYNRPDRWTRAKVNHVDLYIRPEVPADRMTRGQIGLKGAKDRIAMEAWLVDGHREWAIFAMPPGKFVDETKKGFEWNPSLRKAHVVEGVWPLDRLNRLTLVWNSDGSPVSPEDSKPTGVVGGVAGTVLKELKGRGGLQAFNGSEGRLRGTSPPPAGWNGQVENLRAGTNTLARMVETAITAYMSSDDSACPSVRSMLPWADPEALNPFYQGMENMNFNADRYRYVLTFALRLAAMGHPEARKFIDHAVVSFDMALGRYVYPQSGCWEESHGYAGHTIKTVTPMVQALANSGIRDFSEDLRFARMLEFFLYVHSPVDAEFGKRVVPPVGDHGLSKSGPAERFKSSIVPFMDSKNADVQRIMRQVAWMMKEDDGKGPAGIEPEKPDLRSRWLQGYGTVMRAKANNDAESFLVLRAGQSWGHHHQDKGSMWFWGRNVHFFGDADWGGPPGGTYWNLYKQGPASGTQIEFVGVNNWPLPCKYPAPWISDEEYAAEFDYANARCEFPYNPKLNLAESSPVAFRNAYDRQVLFIHPDVVVVRDNVETVCPTIWRLHSYQPAGTTVKGNRATLESAHNVTGDLAMLYPTGVNFTTSDYDDLNEYKDKDGNPADPRPVNKFKSSIVLRWDMPKSTHATWAFGVRGKEETALTTTILDKEGRVTKVKLPDGREAVVLLNGEPFQYKGEGIEFEGTVGLVVRVGDKTTTHAIRAAKLKVE